MPIRPAVPPVLPRLTEASTVEDSQEAASMAAVATAERTDGIRPTPTRKDHEIMNHNVKNPTRSVSRFKAAPLIAVPLVAYLQVCEAQPSNQWTFSSAEEASRALFVAVQSQDSSTLQEILGQNTELISSNDAARDEFDRNQFVSKYRQMHRLAPAADGATVLYIGAENWPFPIPLVLQDGRWRYDSDAGEQEILYRRIGENEVAAIEACRALVVPLTQPKAQVENGSSADILLKAARAEQTPLVSHGYSFRILSSPGRNKLELVAFPVMYGSSGVMTFIVNDAGVVYQKDLGASTETIVTKMAVHPNDSTWARVEAELANSR